MAGTFADAPAVIEYERHAGGRRRGEGKEETAASSPSSPDGATAAGGMEKASVYSTGRGMMRVISKFEYITHVKGHRREWSFFLVGVLLLTGLPYLRYRKLKGQMSRMSLASALAGSANGSPSIGKGGGASGHNKSDRKK